MLEVYLRPIGKAVYIFFPLSLVLLIPVCVFHYRRFGYLRPFHAFVFYSFLLYALPTVFLTVLPLPEYTSDFCEVHAFASQPQLIPFYFVVDLVEATDIFAAGSDLISILSSSAFLHAFLNFLLLMPLGFYLRYYFQVNFRLAGLITIATTLSFELTQLTGIYGLYPCPYRLFDVDDLILNASGAFVGYAIAPLLLFLPDPQQRHRLPSSRVSVPRRLVAFAIDWFLASVIARLLASLLLPQPVSWVNFAVYFGWFIGTPTLWSGQTLGKRLVLIYLTQPTGKPVTFSQLCVRYGILIFLPLSLNTAFMTLVAKQRALHGYISRGWAIVYLGLVALEVLILLGVVVTREDHRGVHEIVSRTQNAIKRR